MSRFNESELSRKIDDTIVAHLQTGALGAKLVRKYRRQVPEFAAVLVEM